MAKCARIILVALAFGVVLTGCSNGASNGGCESNADCTPGVCVAGECEECATNPDCDPGYECMDYECVEMTGGCQADSCSGHGSCDDSSGQVVCTCEAGYTGTTCGQCATGYQDYGDGNCRPEDPCADDTDCAGQNRECENLQGVATCGDCLPGYYEDGSTCVEDVVCSDTSCSGHGGCDDSSGQVVCTCDPGYGGTHCQECADGYVPWPADSDVCVDDPCDPDPCDEDPYALPDACQQTGSDQFTCQCEDGYTWSGEACVDTSLCDDEDNDGYGEGDNCLGPDCDDSDPEINEGHAELCDLKDNDCDTATDEDWPDLGTDCDGSDDDLCASGTLVCSPDGAGTECHETGPGMTETCNGEDDDCDGSTDEDWPDLGTDCDGSDDDLCANGTQACSPDEAGTECHETGPGMTETCNGEDDDCDGSTDEDWPDLGTDCDGSDDDLCANGTQACSPDEAGTECHETGPGMTETCNGEDDDCDGSTDEDWPDLGTDCDGSDDDLCANGTQACSPDEAGTECHETGPGMTETCNGEDDDCDGSTDEEWPELGDTCDGTDSDDCQDGTWVCRTDGSDAECDDDALGIAESCNNLDDDCDGSTDEDWPELGDTCDGTDSDDCLDGNWVCRTDGSDAECDDDAAGIAESCNNLDDDCDGSTDEDWPELGDTCDGTDSDDCLDGNWVCRTDGSDAECDDDAAGIAESCNSLDDDCDGSTDEDWPELGDTCDGTDSDDCLDGNWVCRTDGSDAECDDDAAGIAESCNSLDDDCDGDTDEPAETDPACFAMVPGTDRCCDGVCIDSNSHAQHCGACDNPCGDPGGGLCCAGGCTAPDGSNCGACGVPCFEGMLLINELMINPNAVDDSEGEWIEIYNPNPFDIDLRGFLLVDAGTDFHQIVHPDPVIVPAMNYAVLGRNTDPAANGGVTLVYEYSGYDLGNSGDEVVVLSITTFVDEVWYASNFDEIGASQELSINHMDVNSNNDPANWCDAMTPFGDGDNGTPGMANDCDLPP